MILLRAIAGNTLKEHVISVLLTTVRAKSDLSIWHKHKYVSNDYKKYHTQYLIQISD